MKTATQKLDRNDLNTLRNLEREESFQDRLNLTPQQEKWEDAFQYWKESAYGGDEIEFLSIGFALFRGEKLVPFSERSPLVPADDVRMLLANRVPTRHWVGDAQRRRWRLNFQIVPIRAEEGELYADNSAEGVDPAGVFQKDLLKMPMQDHQRFELVKFDPAQAKADEDVLSSPASGKYAVVRTDRHINLMIGSTVVYRFMKEAVNCLEFIQEDHQYVTHGTPLVKLVGRCAYGKVRWIKGQKIPMRDRISPDVVSATREAVWLEYAAHIMTAMGQLHEATQRQLMIPPKITPLRDWAPRHMLEFDACDLVELTFVDGWIYTPALKRQILEGLWPGGRLRVLSPVPGTVCRIEQDKVVILVDGEEELVVVPCVREDLEIGQSVRRGDVLGDWAERRDWEWSELEKYPFFGRIVQAFLEGVVVTAGQRGYTGANWLIDADFVPRSMWTDAASHWLDFSRAFQFLTETGIIAGCPVGQPNWQDFAGKCGNILYNARPAGDRFSPEPIAVARR